MGGDQRKASTKIMTRKEQQDRKMQLREAYTSGLSTRQVAEQFGMSSSYVHKVCQDLSRSRGAAAILRRPATSKHWRSSRAAARNVWIRSIGSIPKGHHIHHKDGDHTNNNLSNLECLSASEHSRHHHPKNPIPRHLRPGRREYMKAYFKSYWERKRSEISK